MVGSIAGLNFVSQLDFMSELNVLDRNFLLGLNYVGTKVMD